MDDQARVFQAQQEYQRLRDASQLDPEPTLRERGGCAIMILAFSMCLGAAACWSYGLYTLARYAEWRAPVLLDVSGLAELLPVLSEWKGIASVYLYLLNSDIGLLLFMVSIVVFWMGLIFADVKQHP